MSSPPYTNIFGRKPGRGVRPWLLIPKVIAVATFVGGYVATIVVWFSSGFAKLQPGDPQRMWTINLVGTLIRSLVVPAVLCVILFGVFLLLQHPRQFLRMRWLIVKLILLAALTPAAHFYLFSHLAALRQAEGKRIRDDLTAANFGRGLVVALAGYLCILILGRLKPRLGQNIAAAFPKPQSSIAAGSISSTS